MEWLTYFNIIYFIIDSRFFGLLINFEGRNPNLLLNEYGGISTLYLQLCCYFMLLVIFQYATRKDVLFHWFYNGSSTRYVHLFRVFLFGGYQLMLLLGRNTFGPSMPKAYLSSHLYHSVTQSVDFGLSNFKWASTCLISNSLLTLGSRCELPKSSCLNR